MSKKVTSYIHSIILGFIFLITFFVPKEVFALEVGGSKSFEYTNGIQVFKVEKSGFYKLETWGAQGGNQGGYYGGYGGYATGVVMLKKGQTVYVSVGGAGVGASYQGQSLSATYNGGGGVTGTSANHMTASGGGATHIALKAGLLSTLSNDKDQVLIVSGGGGGARNQANHEPAARWGHGGSGGGYIGGGAESNFGGYGLTTVVAVSGTQTSGNAFGQGGSAYGNSGGGGGFFGGFSGGSSPYTGSGGGGSGYIANPALMSYADAEKIMYCYNCQASENDSTRTVRTGSVSGTATEKKAKTGHGAAKITLLKLADVDARLSSIDVTGTKIKERFDPDTYTYDVTVDSDNYEVDLTATALKNTTIVEGEGTYTLKVGMNPITVTGTSESGDIAIYTLNIYRPASNYAYLTDITVNGKSIGNFAPTTLNYTINLLYDEDEIELGAFYGHPGQNIDGIGKIKVPSGESSKKIEVMSEDKQSTTTYNIRFIREHSSKLKSLQMGKYDLEPVFHPDTLEYTLNIMNSTLSLDVTATPYDEEATVSLKGFGYINQSTTGTITVTEPNCAPTVYQITILKDDAPVVTPYEFPYTGKIQTFTAPMTGYYRLETWGAQGGSTSGYLGGYGGYSTGVVMLKKDEVIYIVVGGKGLGASWAGQGLVGGYNGGAGVTGNPRVNHMIASGGGATHIARKTGLLSSLEEEKDYILMVSGGGGGARTQPNHEPAARWGNGGSGGGATGGYAQSNNGTMSLQNVSLASGGQSRGFAFGQGESAIGNGAGGGGLYGGYSGEVHPSYYYGTGGGGSGYIGNKDVFSYRENSKVMYCYNCPTSEEESTYTENTSNYSVSPISYYAKGGDGYARVTLLEQPSENNFLSMIKTDKGQLSPAYEMGVEDYRVELTSEDDEITISASLEDDRATMTGLGTFDVPAGETDFPITVTAENGDIRIYMVTVSRPASSNAKPSNISISGFVPVLCAINEKYCKLNHEFSPDIHDYTITVPSRIKDLEFTVNKGHKYQKVKGEGVVKLKGGVNDVTIEIESEDGTNTERYTYHIDRDMTGNANIEMLEVIDPKTDINFDPDVTDYYFSVPNECTQVELKVTLEDENATYKIFDNKNFVIGLNVVSIEVTAENGEVKTYMLNIYREQSGNTFLSELSVSKDSEVFPLSPTFNKVISSYTVNVRNDVEEVTITAKAEHALTTITGDGVKKLKTGTNNYEITTTAEDGSVQVYEVSIIREKDSDATLKVLDVLESSLNPTFESNTFDYTLDVNPGVTSLNVNVVPNSKTATYQITGNSGFVVGENTVKITVTAEDGTKNVYTLTVNRIPNSNTYLKSLTTDRVDMTGLFSKEIEDYDITVENEVDSIRVDAIPEEVLSTVSGNMTYRLKTGENKLPITVMAEDGSSRTYIITVHRKQNSNANLISLTTSAQAELAPTFSPDELVYQVDLLNEEKKITVVGVPETKTSVVSGNGEYEVPTGETTIPITVTAEDGTKKEYKLIVNRKKSNNANASMIIAQESVLSPKFEKNKTDYILKVIESVTNLTLNITLEDEASRYEILDNHDFVLGEYNRVIVRVTAEDGTTKDYNLDVLRQKAGTTSNRLEWLKIDSGELSPSFDKETGYYEVEVPYEIDNVTLTGELEDQNASVTGLTSYNLNVGTNVLGVEVTSVEGVSRTYQVVVTRKKNTEARLASLQVMDSNLAPNFHRDTTQYNLKTTQTSLYINATTIDSNATYEIIGNHDFSLGANEVIIRVTAADGVTTKDYVLNVEKEKSSNNNLLSLEVLGHSLSPTFAKTTTVYYLDVERDCELLDVVAVPEDENATITGDGEVPLTVGINYVTVTVTSEAGSKKAYTIIVNRKGSSNAYLATLATSDGNLSPEFIKTTNEYNVTVPYETEEVTLTGMTEDANAYALGLECYYLEVGKNSLQVTVVAEDGTTNIYTVNITRDEIVSSKLKEVIVKDYALNQTFSQDVYDYNLVVDNEITNLDLTIVPIDKGATWEVVGNENFKVGMNQVQIIVRDRNGGGPSTYTLNVNRQNYANTYLAYIYPNVGELSPEFDKTNLTYTVTVENEVESINIAAEPEITTNTLTGDGTHLLKPGDNTFPLTVTTPTGIKRTYYVKVERKLKSLNHLTSLEVKAKGETRPLSPSFDKTHEEYHVDVEEGCANVQINATAEEGATIEGIGNKVLKVGENHFDIVVIAENGEKRTYKLTVNRPASNNANLIDIIPSVGELTPSFSYTKDDYNIYLDSSASLLSFTVVTEDRFAKTSGTEPMVVPDGASVREIVVTAEDGTTKTYTIHIHKDRTDEARLKSLKIEGYTLNEVFDKDKHDYTLSVPNSKNVVLSSEIEALPIDANATVTKTSSLILSSTATNIYTIIVTAKDGFTKETYTIAIDREKGSDSTLAKLEFAFGKMSPVFSPTTTEYELLIPRGITSIAKPDVKAIPTDPDALVTLPENFLYDSTNNTYEITVQSPDKTSQTTYTVHIGDLKSSDATLKELTTDEGRFTPTFTPSGESYTVAVRSDLAEITIDATPNDEPYAKIVSGTGTYALEDESNNFDVVVTAEDGTTKVYHLTVVKSISTEKNLKDIFLSGDCTKETCPLSPEFREETLDYTVEVENEIENINIEVTKFHNGQIVRVFDDKTLEEVQATNILLKTGHNPYRVEVENNIGDKTVYTLDIVRKKSSNNYLTSLRLKDPEITLEDFDKEKLEYFVTIPSTYDKVELEYETEVKTAKVHTQGTTYLMPGNNDVKIIVTAEDGTTRTYTIHTEKEKGYNNYLQSLTVSSGVIYPLTPKFNKLVYNYVATVPYGVSKIKLDAVAEDMTTTVQGTGEKELRVGTNAFQIASIAATGETQIYNVVITREKSTRLHLKELTIHNARRIEDFHRDRFTYTVDADSTVTRLNMTIVPERDDVTYRVVGNNNLKTGENTVIIILESQDKTVSTTYKLTVNKRASSDNFLKSLKVNKDELITEENIVDNYFEAEVSYDTASVTIEGIPRADTSTVVTGNGTYSLDFGVNSIFLTVIAEDGSTRDYEVAVKRKYDNHLLMLSTNRGELTPEFEQDTLFYYVDVPRDVSDITVLAVPNSQLTTVTGAGYYTLEMGENLIYVTVSARDKTSRTYTLHIHRVESDNNYIASFSALDAYRKEPFEREKTDYTLEVPNHIKQLDFYVELEDKYASYRIEGNENFHEGDNPVKIIVTAENGDERVYNINVLVQEEAKYSNRLLDLRVEKETMSPIFDPDTTAYTVTVPYSTEEVKVTGVLESVDAKAVGFGTHAIKPGRNEIQIVVTSKDGKTRVYTVIVYRIKSSDARLKSVEFEGVTFSPLFDKDRENYKLKVDSNVVSLNEKVEPYVAGTTYEITGNHTLSGNTNTITIVATAEDGVTKKTYTFQVEKEASYNNYLDSLTTNLWELTPSFEKTNSGPYIIDVDSSINSIVLNGKPESATSTVAGLGFHTLKQGRNQFPIVVTAENGATRTYTLIVNKGKSSESGLMFLGVNEGTLTPVFDPEVKEYTVDVDHSISEITVVAYAKDKGSVITGDGLHSLDVGENKIDVVVTAEDGTVNTYILRIRRGDLISSKLLDIKAHEGMLAPEFDKNTTDYVVRIPNEVNSLTLDIKKEDDTATYEIVGNKDFVIGPNPVEIVVTDRLGGQTTYTLTVIKRPEVNNYLRAINISEGTLAPEFVKEHNYYEVEVDSDISSIDVEGILEDESATLEGNGTYTLVTGENYIYLNVTSMKGFLRTYTLKVTRKAASDNELLSLSVTPGEMDQPFSKELHTYHVTVEEGTTEVMIEATASATSTVTGVGKQILAIGMNRYEVVVTAEDGSVNTYEILIEKNPSSNTNIENIIPSSGTLSPEYTSTVESYEVEVEEDVALIDFDVILESKTATITGDKNNYLDYGSNDIVITVTAEDGSRKEVHISVIRDKKLTDIKLDDFLLMEVGDVIDLEPDLLPEDAISKELIWAIEDESIATVDEGTVTAKALGDTVLTVSSKKNPEVKAVVNISVLNLKITSEVYDVRREVVNMLEIDPDAIKNIIIGADEGETLDVFLSKLDNRESLIKFYDINGARIEKQEEVSVATGLVVRLEYNSKVYDEAYIAVRGENTQDAAINVDDFDIMINQVLGKLKYTKDHLLYKTMDAEENDEINVDDIDRLDQYILGKIKTLN